MTPLLPNGQRQASPEELECYQRSQIHWGIPTPPPKQESIIGNVLGYVVGGVFMLIVFAALLSNVWGFVGEVTWEAFAIALGICITWPIVPVGFVVFLLICLVLSLWEHDQRRIIRSELEKFHRDRD